MIKILIGIPTYDRRIDIEILKGAMFLERTGKYHIDFVFPISSHISKNRNYCVKQCLAGEYDYLLFWDSDIALEGDFIEKLIESGFKFNAEIMCGVYAMKNDEKKLVLARRVDVDKFENLTECTKPMLVDAGGTGIMLIARRVLSIMPEPHFTIVDKPNLFTLPEDFYFCQEAGRLGINIVADPRVTGIHYGNYPYRP